MSDWAEVFLGIIAFATLTTSIILVALLVAASRLARRVEHMLSELEQQMKPAFVHLNSIAEDAARAASLAVTQVERVDRLFGDVAASVDRTVEAVHGILGGPLRKGGPVVAAMNAFWAVFSFMKDGKGGQTRSRPDDEDALFI